MKKDASVFFISLFLYNTCMVDIFKFFFESSKEPFILIMFLLLLCYYTEKEKEQEKEKEKARKDSLGVFHSLPHYMKLYDVLKGAYSNYKAGWSLIVKRKLKYVELIW